MYEQSIFTLTIHISFDDVRDHKTLLIHKIAHKLRRGNKISLTIHGTIVKIIK